MRINYLDDSLPSLVMPTFAPGSFLHRAPTCTLLSNGNAFPPSRTSPTQMCHPSCLRKQADRELGLQLKQKRFIGQMGCFLARPSGTRSRSACFAANREDTILLSVPMMNAWHAIMDHFMQILSHGTIQIPPDMLKDLGFETGISIQLLWKRFALHELLNICHTNPGNLCNHFYKHIFSRHSLNNVTLFFLET